jgi:hypothetical protein
LIIIGQRQALRLFYIRKSRNAQVGMTMILRLFCPKCAYFAAKERRQNGASRITIDVALPVTQPSDDGKYEVRCAAGHVGLVIVDNVKFELLFEVGLNALVDGYPREAVSSFASALERFYEFYWHTVAAFHSIPQDQADAAWKAVAKQSERQLGMYISAVLILTLQAPVLLNPNKEVKLRNNVIHNGYIPTIEEATEFGNTVMQQINGALATLRTLAPQVLIATYARFSPADKTEPKPDASEIVWDDDEDHTGVVNILTAVDVRYPVAASDDSRFGDVTHQFTRILLNREPHRLTTLGKNEPDEAEKSMH